MPTLPEITPSRSTKYQLADLISHTGRTDLARRTFALIERFIGELLDRIDEETTLVVTSDHGHLEQVGFTKGHPKSKVPTWYFGAGKMEMVELLRRPEGIFAAFDHLARPSETKKESTQTANGLTRGRKA